ncbi:MAG: Uma2 family endonuclease [Archangium sp.]|nr:Uma2 family endonuclease [Archangium sp.]
MRSPLLTYAEYLAQEAAVRPSTSFFVGTPEHGRLAIRAGGLLTNALQKRPCVLYSSALRIRIQTTDRSTYPDLSVVCGKDEHASDDADATSSSSKSFPPAPSAATAARSSPTINASRACRSRAGRAGRAARRGLSSAGLVVAAHDLRGRRLGDPDLHRSHLLGG